ncbi:MAG TPA: hemerythrin domain-containing protein [Planctomycetota bacterium]
MTDTRIRAPQATDLLKEDHRKVRRLFQEYGKLGDDAGAKAGIFESLHQELTLHARIEEEIFYPAVAEAVEDEETADLIEEARESHEEVKMLLEEMTDLNPGDEAFEAKMNALRENVERHAEEEEKELFPCFKELDDEIQEDVAERLRDRRNELSAE